MKKLALTFFFPLVAIALMAQVPAGFSYQAAVRNNSGEIIANKTVKFRFSILPNSETGTPFYVETQSKTTNDFGLVNLVVGTGTKVSGNFDPSAWGSHSHFLKVEFDPNNGNTFSHLGTVQLMAVPYAFHAQTVGELSDQAVTAAKIAAGAVTGNKIAQAGAVAGQALKWTGTTWAPADEGTGGGAWQTSGDNIYRLSGNTGIGTSTPAALLHTHGTGIGGGSVVFTGQLKEGGWEDPPISGAGTRLMWYPDRGSFRVGYVSGDQWNRHNLGAISFASGSNTIASGEFSTAMGHTTTASGSYSTAMGNNSTASSIYSTAIGFNATASNRNAAAIGFRALASGQNSYSFGDGTTASGDFSTAIGYQATASSSFTTAIGYNTKASGPYSYAFGNMTSSVGHYSTAMGYGTVAASAYETVVGYRNFDYDPHSYGQWVAEDRLFVVGNGYYSPSNALTVLKNGNTGISVSKPRQQLSVGAYLDLYSGFANNPIRPSIRASEHNNLIISPSGNGILYFNFDGGSGQVRFHNGTSDGELMRIDGEGRVGIGTASPSQKLHVAGNAYKTEGGTSWAVSSDLRLKTVLGNYNKGLDEITKLEAVRFVYNKDNPRQIVSGSEEVGFVAQDVQKIFPEAVSEAEDGYLDFNIHAINIALVNAIKELKAENDRLKAETRELNSRVEKLERIFSASAQHEE